MKVRLKENYCNRLGRCIDKDTIFEVEDHEWNEAWYSIKNDIFKRWDIVKSDVYEFYSFKNDIERILDI